MFDDYAFDAAVKRARGKRKGRIGARRRLPGRRRPGLRARKGAGARPRRRLRARLRRQQKRIPPGMKRFSVPPSQRSLAGFNTQNCNSPNYLSNIQRLFGTFDCPRNALKGPFYDFTNIYPAAGAAQFNFFGVGINSTNNRQLTNLARPNSFTPDWFLLHKISLGLYIESQALGSWVGTDATTLVSEVVAGLCSAGFFELRLSGTSVIEEPMPFYRMPPADGRYLLMTEGVRSITVTDTSPTSTVTAFVTAPPVAFLASKLAHNGATNGYICDPPIMFKPEDPFQATLSYFSGAVAATATSIFDNSTTFLRLGLIFEGVRFKPTA